MLPGQIGIWIIGVTSALLLGVMGIFSYRSYQRAQLDRLLSAAQKEEQEPPMPQPQRPTVQKSRGGHNDFGFKF